MNAREPRIGGRNRSGMWEIRWSERTAGGGWRSRSLSTGTADREEAEAVLARRLAEWRAAQAQAGTVAALISAYLAGARMRGVKTTQHVSLGPVAALLGSYTPAGLTPDVVREYIKARAAGRGTRQKRAASGPTCRRELGALRTVLLWAEKTQLIGRGTAPHIDLPPPGAARDVWLDEAQAEAVWRAALAASPPEGAGRLSRVTRFVAIAMETAARKDAIEKLTWDRVDLGRRLIDFRDPALRATKKRRVPVPISDRLFGVLVRAKAEARGCFVCDEGSIRKAFETWAERVRAALPGCPRITPHVLRHTWATLAARRGVPLWQIAGVLGDTMATVEAHYAHHAPDHLRSAVEAPGAGRGAVGAAMLANLPPIGLDSGN